MPPMTTEYNKDWYSKNRKDHLKYCATQIECECGRKIARATKGAHIRTAIHKNLMNKQKQKEDEIRKSVIREVLNINNIKDLDPTHTETSELSDIPELSETEHIEPSILLPIEEIKTEVQPIVSKCDKCGFESEDKIKYRNHFVTNKHKYSKYQFED